MKTSAKIFLFTMGISVLTACNTKEEQTTYPKDYNQYLSAMETPNYESAQKEFDFWNTKYKDEPSQYPYLSKIAGANNELFGLSGKIDYLIAAEENLKVANEKTNYSSSGYLRSLAHNYVSQHRFKEALELLKIAEKNGDNLESTQKMLFDVNLELGNDEAANNYLAGFKDFNDFDYLIRLSKWSDHIGNLDEAIRLMEKARTIAVDSKNKTLQQWVYTNIADYYGHAGRIQDAYHHYLKALELNPTDSYSMKGIAWIVYSHEKNPEEALRIIETISNYHQSPDYYLLKAEISEFQNNEIEKNANLEAYFYEVDKPLYGNMYNKYNVILYSEVDSNKNKALEIAQKEIANRPTVLSYDLLAWAYFNKGEIEKAMQIADNNVYQKTSEPEVLYHLAEIYKANKANTKTEALKAKLAGTSFELGPVTAKKIRLL